MSSRGELEGFFVCVWCVWGGGVIAVREGEINVNQRMKTCVMVERKNV